MEKLSLDAEPPPRFLGEKEINKKKNRNLPQLIFSARNERNKNKFPAYAKNLEKQVKDNAKAHFADINYSSLERYFHEENKTPTSKDFGFTKLTIANPNLMAQEFNYVKKLEENASAEKKIQNFYSIVSSYSFIFPATAVTQQIFAKEQYKKKEEYLELKEQEEKEAIYALHAFEEEKKEEDNSIKWNPSIQN